MHHQVQPVRAAKGRWLPGARKEGAARRTARKPNASLRAVGHSCRPRSGEGGDALPIAPGSGSQSRPSWRQPTGSPVVHTLGLVSQGLPSAVRLPAAVHDIALAEIDPDKNLLIRAFRRFVPITPDLHGQRFFVCAANGWHATPLFVALLFLEATDVVFAIDSVPAIFALTREPFIVFTSNICAILGLRALYFMLAGAIDRFHLLKYGLAVVLVFVGLKMVWLNDLFGGKFPISLALAIISVVIATSVGLSFMFPKSRSQPVEHA
jgi:predicted tellurium resistance membrane protein TerC